MPRLYLNKFFFGYTTLMWGNGSWPIQVRLNILTFIILYPFLSSTSIIIFIYHSLWGFRNNLDHTFAEWYHHNRTVNLSNHSCTCTCKSVSIRVLDWPIRLFLVNVYWHPPPAKVATNQQVTNDCILHIRRTRNCGQLKSVCENEFV